MELPEKIQLISSASQMFLQEVGTELLSHPQIVVERAWVFGSERLFSPTLHLLWAWTSCLIALSPVSSSVKCVY